MDFASSGAAGAEALALALRDASLPERLSLATGSLTGRLVFTTSFGLEDQAITHAIFRAGLDLHIELVTLDT